MVREWPRRQAQTQAAMKKEKPLEEKVLADVRKRVSQIEKTLKPVLENSSVSSNTTKEAERTAHAVAKVCVQSVPAMTTAFPSASAVLCVQNCSALLCKYSKYLQILCCRSSSLQFYLSASLHVQESKAILTQAKHTRTASAHLSSHVDSALQQLTEQEMLTDTANSQITSEVTPTRICTHLNSRIYAY